MLGRCARSKRRKRRRQCVSPRAFATLLLDSMRARVVDIILINYSSQVRRGVETIHLVLLFLTRSVCWLIPINFERYFVGNKCIPFVPH